MIEFMGGGACWDAQSCEYNAEMLSMREAMDDYLGYSCSEIQAGIEMNDGDYGGDDNVPVNMLCAQTLGDDLDLRDYHTIIVPYCTQDVHMGDSEMIYDADSGTRVHHRGARNMLSVLEWVYDNFAHPEHVILTGCSAGGTILPIAYDLIHHHYNSITKGRHTPVSTLMDSPVYLTPSYFMENGIANWNLEPMMKKMRFNFDKYGQSEEFSERLIQHVLKRGSRKDKLGLVTHNNDPVSIAYYEAMSGYYNDDDDGNNNGGGRQLEDNNGNDDDAVTTQWWSDLSASLASVTKSRKNVDTFILDGEGHCSFGLYYAQAEGGDGFQNWAGKMLLPRSVKKAAVGGSQRFFWVSALLGAAVVGLSIYHQRQLRTAEEAAQAKYDCGDDDDDDDDTTVETKGKGPIQRALQFVSAFVSYYTQDSPVTIGYGVATTIYFICAIAWNGLEDFLYNPSVGPSANTLSSFGINNPTLIVYHSQLLRLVTSTFLCSGMTTYFLFLYSLSRYVRPLEQTLRAVTAATNNNDGTKAGVFASRSFLEIASLVAIGSNLVYACLTSGASCSSMALVFGLQAFALTMNKYHGQKEFSRHWFTNLSMYILVCLLPFNSWIMMTSAIFLGVGLAIWIYPPVSALAEADDYESYTEGSTEDTGTKKQHSVVYLVRKVGYLQGLLALMTSMLVVLALRIRRPNRLYEQPFMTSCDLVYTSNVNDVVNGYLGGQFNDGGGDDAGDANEERLRRRWLEEQADDDAQIAADEEYMCAQLCLPRLVSRPAIWGANLYFDFDVQKGFCEDVGYSQHVADKTFSYMKYSADVELYFQDDYNYNQNDDGDNR